MAIDFNDRVLITNPTIYYLGRGVLILGLLAIIAGFITHYTGDVILPANAWYAAGVPTTVIGFIFLRSGLTRN